MRERKKNNLKANNANMEMCKVSNARNLGLTLFFVSLIKSYLDYKNKDYMCGYYTHQKTLRSHSKLGNYL